MRNTCFFILILFVLSGCNRSHTIEQKEIISVSGTRDQVIERIIKQVPASQLDSLTVESVMQIITPEEKEIFANNHWRFTVDKPALVSVMRNKKQAIIPFWLTEKGFVNTGKFVANENAEYEVWQKEYPAGNIFLGINGFDMNRMAYFVTIGPVANGTQPKITNVYPDLWKALPMKKGTFVYHDWDELVITELPMELVGHTLFTTIRGRAREAAIVGAFRKTEYPSSQVPDQIVLTWGDDPKTSQSIQWRTDTTVAKSVVKYWEEGKYPSEATTLDASAIRLSDVYIYNNPMVSHWEVTIKNLQPDTRYNYQVITENKSITFPTYSFRTAPDQVRPFKFIHLGDTHNEDIVKSVMEAVYKEYPDAGFIIHSGDHVNTGLFRNLWDKYFEKGKNVFPYLTLAPILGNHDSQDGLPPVLYTQLFMLHQDTTCHLPAERNYSFAYSNARFFMIDATGDVDQIACWLEKELQNSKEQWKIAVTHFPPYTQDDSYPEIREKWCSLFDKYHIDLVLSGHIHQYFRSYPIYANEVVDNPNKGTIYTSSLVVKTPAGEIPSKKYNQVFVSQGGLFQVIEVTGNQLNFLSKSQDGKIIDRFQIVKSLK